MVRIRREAATEEIELQLNGGERIVCLVTSNRALSLRLRVGGGACALVSPSSVIVMVEGADTLRFFARNQLAGTITRLNAGAQNIEVVIALRGSDELGALISNLSAKELQLTQCKPVSALFKSTGIILGGRVGETY